MTAVARPLALDVWALRRPHCQPSHIEKNRHLGAMSRKDSGRHKALALFFIFFFALHAISQTEPSYVSGASYAGASQLMQLVPQLQGQRVAIVAHAASLSLDPRKKQLVHTVDRAVKLKLNVVKIFSPEHGFTGSFSAGEHIEGQEVEGLDIPMVSLYGSHKKPTLEDLSDVDVVLFDLQDVGVRFYTYISTLSYVMEACAEQGKSLIVLDRPNPFSDVVDGPVLDTAYSSFVGMHPVPVLYGLTMGEYARMVAGEGWIAHAESLTLSILPCLDYHRQPAMLAVPPSPNLPNAHAIALYPSLCFFEATPVSVGRGTDAPFERFGAPWMDHLGDAFVPSANEGARSHKFEGQTCFGQDLRSTSFVPEQGLDLDFLHQVYHAYVGKGMDSIAPFFTSFMDKLAGGPSLEDALTAGASVEAIKDSWQEGLDAYRQKREAYLLYPRLPEPSSPVMPAPETPARKKPKKKAP